MPGNHTGLIVGIDPGLAGTGFAVLAEPNRVVACDTVSNRHGEAIARYERRSGHTVTDCNKTRNVSFETAHAFRKRVAQAFDNLKQR